MCFCLYRVAFKTIQELNKYGVRSGVLMARWKTAASGGPATRAEVSGAACAAHVSRLAAAALVRAGAPQHCFKILSALLPYWKEKTSSMWLLKSHTCQLLKIIRIFAIVAHFKA